MRADKLKAVAVAGGDEAFAALLFAKARDCAENVVGFPPLRFNYRVAKVAQKLLYHGELVKKLFRRWVPPRLIFAVHFVAEGRRVNVKGKNNGVGLYLRH